MRRWSTFGILVGTLFFKLGNILGRVIQMDDSFLTNNLWIMAWVLVDIDTRDVLLDTMEIEVGNVVHYQVMDYQNMSLFCAWCHLHGHMVVNDCVLLFKQMAWKWKYISAVDFMEVAITKVAPMMTPLAHSLGFLGNSYGDKRDE